MQTQRIELREIIWADSREFKALIEENEGEIWTRTRNVSDRAFEALLKGAGT